MEHNIKKILNTPFNELTQQFVDSDQDSHEEYLFDFIGKVVDNNDPDKIGRCRIRVFGVFTDDIKDNELPWALPEFGFIGSKVGNFIVPPKDAIVKIKFNNGNIYEPVYTTKVVDKNNLPSQRLNDYPDTMVLFQTDEGDYLTVNRKTGVVKYKCRNGAQIVIDDDDVTIHHTKTVRLDAGVEVIIGGSSGYVVTSPYPGQIVTYDGHVLTAQEKVRA